MDFMSTSLPKIIGVALLAVFFPLFVMNVETVQARAAMNHTVPPIPPREFKNETEVMDKVQAGDIRFYKLALQWPGSFARSCRPHALSFSIHGLWPTLHGDAQARNCLPEECRSRSNNAVYCSKFDLNFRKVIHPIKARMKSEWPSLQCGPLKCGNDANGWFWGHEWDRHGVCWMLIPENTQKSYFNKAHHLKERVNLLGALKDKGILPSNQAYLYSKIHIALTNASRGHEVQIICNNGWNQVSELSEVYICFDLDLQFTSCPPRRNCDKWVVFPPTPTRTCVN